MATGFSLIFSQPSSVQSVQTTQSLPTATTTVVNYGCSILSPPPAQGSETGSTSDEASNSSAYSYALMLVNTTQSEVQLLVNASSGSAFNPTACSYTYTDASYPVECGVTCGNGIGYVNYLTYIWELNFSLVSPTYNLAQNLTLIPETGQLSDLMPAQNNEVALDLSPITWYSNPPCSNGVLAESNCLSTNVSSITIDLPPLENGAYQLILNSTETSAP